MPSIVKGRGKNLVLDALKTVMDPELGVNIIDMGFVYGVEIIGKKVRVEMTLTIPSCPHHSCFVSEVGRAVRSVLPGSDVEVKMVFDPPWDPGMIRPEGMEKLAVMQSPDAAATEITRDELNCKKFSCC